MKAQAVGAVLLVLALVGTLSSWSAMRHAPDGAVYVTVNVVLALVGLTLVLLGTVRRRRDRADSPPER